MKVIRLKSEQPRLLLNQGETAKELGISLSTLQKLVRQGALSAPKPCNKRDPVPYFQEATLRRFYRRLAPEHSETLNEQLAERKWEAIRDHESKAAYMFLKRSDFGFYAAIGDFDELAAEHIGPYEEVVGGGVACGDDLYANLSGPSFEFDLQVRKVLFPISAFEKMPEICGMLYLLPPKSSLVLFVASQLPPKEADPRDGKK